MNDNSILLKTLRKEKTNRPPVWYMRQAGRVLPSYLKLKEKYTFWQMMQNPELAADVTLLPVHDLGVDAAILFSDILVIPYAMGMGLDFTDAGPVFENPLAFRKEPFSFLTPDEQKLEYIYKVIDQIVIKRPDNTPLVGFCGAPLTVMLFMLQGLGRKGDFPDATRFIYSNLKDIKILIDKITDLSIIYANEQIKHGIDAFQLFDTHAGILPFSLYKELFFPSIKKISKAVRDKKIPFIFFPKGIGTGIAEVTPDMADFLSIDWQTPIKTARKLVDKSIGLQGNIDPRLLFAEQNIIANKLESYLDFGRRNDDWVINLGHGFLPGIPIENVIFMTNWVKNADWS